MDEAILWMKAHQDLSGWVQAIGSIAALLLAFAVVFVQHHLSVAHARRNIRQEDIAVVLALAKLAQGLRAALGRAEAAVTRGFEYSSYKKAGADLADYEDIFQFLPIDQLVMHNLSIQYLGLRSMARDSADDFVMEGMILRTNAEKLRQWGAQCDQFIQEINTVADAIERNMCILR